MTVLEAITKGTDFLQRKGIESPRLQTELLLAHLLKLPRLRLYLEFERPLPEQISATLRELLVKRGNRTPLQYLTGSTSFCGCEILVSPGVLIPRPETEILAEAAWIYLNALNRPATFLDLGTGSGCLPIAIAAHAKNARGVSVDISESALAIARQNIEKNKLTERIELKPGDLRKPLSDNFDLIVSNPPYIPSAEVETLQPEVRDHEPRSALDGGPDGLDFIRAIAAKTNAPCAMIEFADGQGSAAREIFASAGWRDLDLLRDLNKEERVLKASR